MARFDMEPRWPQIMQTLPGMSDTLAQEVQDWTEMMNRRDLNLEDFLNQKVGQGSRWGTVVVAAADSSAAGKASADYVGDGVSDESVLTAAIAALPVVSPGFRAGRIVLLEGNFILSAPATVPSGFALFVLQGQGYPEGLTTMSTTGALIDGSAGFVFVEARDLGIAQDGGGGPAARAFSGVFSLGLRNVTYTASGAGQALTDSGQVVVRDSNLTGSATAGVPLLTGASASLSVYDSSVLGTDAGIYSGAGVISAVTSQLAFNGGSARVTLALTINSILDLDSCRLLGSIQVNSTALPGTSQVHLIGNKFGNRFVSDAGADAFSTHQLALVALGSGVVRGNTFNRFAAPGSPNTFDNVHLEAGGGTGSSKVAIVDNDFQPLGSAGNMRCNIRIEDALCTANRVLFNDTPGGLTGDLCDFGTGTVKTVLPGTIPGFLSNSDAPFLYMLNEPGLPATSSAPTAQDDTLTYMVNEDGPA